MTKRSLPVDLSGFVTFAVICLLETGAVMTLTSDLPVGPMVDMLLAFAFHLGAACILSYGFWGAWTFSRAEDKNWAVIGFVLVLTLPVFGLVGYTVAYGLFRFRRRLDLKGPEVLDEFDRYVAYEPEIESALRDHPRRPTAGVHDEAQPTDVAPLIDILKSGDRDLKRGAIFSVARLDRRTAVKILRESLMDSDREIQFYAAGQLSKIEKDLSEHILRARRRLQVEPDAVDVRAEMGLYCKDYALSGLLDPSVERYFVRQAVEAFEKVLEADPARGDVLMAMADLHRSQGDHAAAVSAYRRALFLDPSSNTARIGMAHSFFAIRDFGNLGSVLEELTMAGEIPEDLGPVIDFWKATTTPSTPSHEPEMADAD